MNLHIITNIKKHYIINLETNVINGFDRWIFAGLKNIRSGAVISPNKISAETLKELELNNRLFFKNEKCQWQVVDIDCGTFRTWGESILRIWID